MFKQCFKFELIIPLQFILLAFLYSLQEGIKTLLNKYHPL